MVDLILVNPSGRELFGELSSSITAIEPPFWAGLIASFIREHGFKVMIIDAEAENWSPEYTAERVAQHNPLLVAIAVQGQAPTTSSTPKMVAAGELITALRERKSNIKTLLWGLHPSALPERTLREEAVDFVCQGEGFYTMIQLLQRLKAGVPLGGICGLWFFQDGELVSPSRAKLLDEEELPPVAWDLLPMDKYRAHNWLCLDNLDRRRPYGVTYTSLGCPYNCYFCCGHSLYRGSGKPSIRFRSPEKVINEIDLLVTKYGVRNIKFMDEIFNLREQHVVHLCDLIIQRGYDLNMWGEMSPSTMTKTMLAKMKQAGINWIAYGIESSSERVRQGISKRFSQERLRKTIEMTWEAGIYIQANFCFGLPDDDLETMQATLDMAKGYNFEWVNLYTVMALPGSQLYQDGLRQGIKLPKTWDGYAQLAYETLPMSTKHLSAAEVLAFRDKAFEEYFSRPEYLDMIGGKFGDTAVEHIKEMLKYKVKRKYAPSRVD